MTQMFPWPTCEVPDETCLGAQVKRGLCLRHLDEGERSRILHDGLSAIDVSGTQFTKSMIAELVAEPAYTRAIRFRSAEFDGDLVMENRSFGTLDFGGAVFRGRVSMRNGRFSELTTFEGARFEQDAMFGGSQFADNAVFSGTHVAGRLSFTGASFAKVAWLGPLVADSVDLEGARFAGHAEIVAETGLVKARRVRFDDSAILRLRYAILGLEGANFGVSSSISGSDQPFVAHRTGQVAATASVISRWLKPQPRWDEWQPLLVSLRDSDVGNLVLTDVDLNWCQFAGARRLDQLHIEGRCPLNAPPARWWRARCSVLAEEHFWRAADRPDSGWHAEHPLGERTSLVGASRLAALYRSLRKAFEDGKNEAGAGDFYYGEMEARRRATTTPRPERWILAAYWLLSGYGQRASRALAALVVLVVVVTALLVGWGMPVSAPQQVAGTIRGGDAALTVANAPVALPPAGERWTVERGEKAFQLAMGAVAFRDAGQRLTATGTWTITAARLGGPLLLALAVLAVRARVKR